MAAAMNGRVARAVEPQAPPEPQPEIVLFGKSLAAGVRLDISRTWLVLFLLVAALLFCRQPYALIHPTFYAEDGSIFFKQQYETGFLPSLVTPYAGYLHVAPRLVAAFCSGLPLGFLPAAYAIFSLLIAAAALTFLYAPGFRPLIDSDLLRACLVLIFTVLPNAEPLMKVAYLNWYALYFSALLSLFTLPKSLLGRSALLLVAAIAAWSNPATLVCAPVFLLRLVKAADRQTRLWWAILLLLTLIYPFTMEKIGSPSGMLLHERSWRTALIHAVGYRVFCFFYLGSTLTYPRPWEGWAMAMVISSVLALFTGLISLRAFRTAPKGGLLRYSPLILLYLILALPSLFVLRREWQRWFLTWSIDCWEGSDRYFFSSTLLLGALGGVVYERLFRSWIAQSKQRCELSFLLLLCWLIFQGIGLRLPVWHTERKWTDYAVKIRDTELRVKETGKSDVVHIEGTPPGFDFDLLINQSSSRRHP